MHTTSTMEFSVIDEDLEGADVFIDEAGEDTPPPLPVEALAKRRPGRPRKTGLPVTYSAPVEASSVEPVQQAQDISKLVEEIAGEAASIAVKSAMNEAKGLRDKIMQELEAKVKDISEQYTKPKNLCMHVKLGEMPAVKLSTRAAKVLPDLLAQSKLAMNRSGNWPMIMGPTGCGKTVAAEQVSEVLKLPYAHLNFSEGCSETWLWGRQTPNGFVPGSFWNCYINGGVFLADEMDACNDNVLLSLNTAIGNGKASNPINGESKIMHKDFLFIAATNTNGKGGTGAHTGRTRLDGATLNRFTLFEVGYDRDLEAELCPKQDLLKSLWGIREELEKKGSQDVISSRDIKNAYAQSVAGFGFDKIMHCLKLRMDKSNHSIFDNLENASKHSKKESKNEFPF